MEKKLLTVRELMKALGVKNIKTIEAHRKEGLPTIFVGRNIRFDLDEVIAWYKNRRMDGDAKR